MAERYWVGGTGDWNDTTHWSTTDGGGSGAAVPTSSDNANFTVNSAAGAYVVSSATVSPQMLSLLMANPPSGTLTFGSTAGGGINIFGGFTLCSQFLVGGNQAFNMKATSSFNLTTNGATVPAVTFTGVGGTWVLQDNYNAGSVTTLLQHGTLNLNAKTFATGGLTLNNNADAILNATNATININSPAGNLTPWVASVTLATLTMTGSTLNLNTGSTTFTWTAAFGSYTYGTVNIVGKWTTTGSPTIKNLSITTNAVKTEVVTFSGNITIAASGSLSITGNSVTNRAFATSSALGTQRTITVPNTATVTLTNVDFQDIASAGTFGTWTGTSLGDALGNAGITFDPSVTLTRVANGATKNWSDATLWTGTSNRVPLPQDDVVLPSGIGGQVNADMPRLGRNIDSSNMNSTLSFASLANTIFGNITLGANATYSGTQALTLAGRGAQTITSNGKSFPQAVSILAFGGTYTLQDNFTDVGGFTLTNGTLADGGFSFSSTTFNSSGTNARAINGTGIWSVTQTSGTPWNVTASLVITNAQTIKLTGTNTTTATFAGAGLTYGTLNWSSTLSSGTLIITGANTFADIQTDSSTARTIQLPANTITTVSALSAKGSSGKLLSLTSSTPGTKATLKTIGNAVISSDFLSITDSAATGGPEWYAGANSTNGGDNSGWIFTAVPNTVTVLTRGPSGPAFTRKRFDEIQAAQRAQELAELRAAQLKESKRKRALLKAARQAQLAIAAAKVAEAEVAAVLSEMTAALNNAASAEKIKEAIKFANIAIAEAMAIRRRFEEEEDEEMAIHFLLQ